MKYLGSLIKCNDTKFVTKRVFLQVQRQNKGANRRSRHRPQRRSSPRRRRQERLVQAQRQRQRRRVPPDRKGQLAGDEADQRGQREVSPGRGGGEASRRKFATPRRISDGRAAT